VICIAIGIWSITLENEVSTSAGIFFCIDSNVNAVKPGSSVNLWVASPCAVLLHFTDVAVKVGYVFMILSEKEEILECIAIPADVVSNLVTREFMPCTFIIIQLI
jgi:hypothetical protein